MANEPGELINMGAPDIALLGGNDVGVKELNERSRWALGVMFPGGMADKDEDMISVLSELIERADILIYLHEEDDATHRDE